MSDLHGDCLACQKLSTCTETSVEKVRTSYTCPLFEEVPEPVFLARWEMMQKHGEEIAIEAMLEKDLLALKKDGE